MKKSMVVIFAAFLCATAFRVSAAEEVFKIGDDFSTLSNPHGSWAYGVILNDGSFVPFSTAIQSPDDNGVPVDLWYDPVGGSAIFHNQNDFTIISNGGEGVHPANSVWFHPPLGENERWAAVRFTAPRSGRYSIDAIFTKVLHTVGNDVEVRIQHNGADLFAQTFDQNSDPAAFVRKVNVNAGDTIDFLIGDTGDGNYGDATFFEITLSRKVKSPHEFDIGDDFSMISNPHGAWGYGVILNNGSFVPFSTPTQSPDDNGVPVDLWYDPVGGSAIFHNQNDFTIISNGGEGVHPANSVWFHPPLGENERWAAVRFTAPRSGRYSIDAIFTKVLYTVGNDVEVRIQRNGTDLFSAIFDQNSDPVAFEGEIDLRPGDRIDFLIGDTGDGNYGDATFFDITLSSK